jgi:type II secretory pathway pseudopilin PulG
LRKCKKKGGFSLLELAAAIGIFSVGILTVVTIFQKGILQTAMLYEEEIALETAESIIEHFRAKGLPGGCLEEFEIPLPESLEAAKFLRNLHISLSVRDFEPQSQGLKEITLGLSWQNFGHRKRQITLTTLMADPEQPYSQSAIQPVSPARGAQAYKGRFCEKSLSLSVAGRTRMVK